MTKVTTVQGLDGLKEVAEEIKKRKLNKVDLFEAIMNRQLSQFSRTAETVSDKEMFEFKVTPVDKSGWLEWGVRFIMKQSDNPNHRQRKDAEEEMSWIDYNYGLKVRGGQESEKNTWKALGCVTYKNKL